MPFSFLPRMIYPHLTDLTAEALRARGMKSRLILQVHDELIVEAPQEEAQSAASLLKSCMENIVSLRVPLTAEVNIGRSWYDCK